MKTAKIAFKYVFSSKNSQRTTSIMIILTLAVSITAILIIGSVVDALQSRQLDVLRTVESFDLIVETSLTKEKLSSIPEVSEVHEFGETTAIITIPKGNSSLALRIRAVDFDSYFNRSKIENELLAFPYSNEAEGILLSANTYAAYDFEGYPKIRTTFLKRGKTASLAPYSKNLEICGLYYCSEPSFSQNTAFIELETYKSIFGEGNTKFGIFVRNNSGSLISKILNEDPYAKILTWQEYNKATYSALLLEKVVIYLFMAFMFVLLCANLKNSTARLIRNRQKEGAILRALGCTSKTVTSVFIKQGLILTLAGEGLGILAGYLVIVNFVSVVAFASNVLNFGGIVGYSIGSVLLNVEFSPVVTAVLSLFVFILSWLFVRRGCRQLYKHEIMEVLLNDTY